MTNKWKVSEKIIETIDNLNFDENSIIVYDIDDTLINKSGEPIIPIINTFMYAKNKGIKTAIITARSGTEINISLTEKQLEKFGITGYKFAYYRPWYKNDQETFKLYARKDLFDNGYKVEISIGDMPWDIGLFGGKGFIV